jgi:hypothetical protein
MGAREFARHMVLMLGGGVIAMYLADFAGASSDWIATWSLIGCVVGVAVNCALYWFWSSPA